jgi:hypothetical protein
MKLAGKCCHPFVRYLVVAYIQVDETAGAVRRKSCDVVSNQTQRPDSSLREYSFQMLRHTLATVDN